MLDDNTDFDLTEEDLKLVAELLSCTLNLPIGDYTHKVSLLNTLMRVLNGTELEDFTQRLGKNWDEENSSQT